jgi:hypothetical protein
MLPLIAALVEDARADDPLVPEDDDPELPVPGAPEPEPERTDAPVAPVEPPPEPSGAPAPAAFNFDSLLVTTVQPEGPEWGADAEALEALLLRSFGATNQLVPMSEVPFFDVQGYDGRTYLLGCPPGRYAGCALVIGQRTGVERTVGATIRREPDPDIEGASLRIATFHIVDVGDGREVVSVTVPMPDGAEDSVVAGVMSLFDEVVRGDLALKDLRERADPDQRELTEARKEQIAKALDRLEDKLGVAVVSQVETTIDRPRLTRADLAEYRTRDDQPPWERMRMSPGEYLRFANSGDTYEAWQRGGWGRTTNVLVRVAGGIGPGPWNQRYAGQVLLSDQDLQPVDSAELLEVTRGSVPNFDVEVGFGVLPFLELDFAAGVRPGESAYLYDEDVQNQIPIPGKESTVGITTWTLGGRAHLAPFPRWPARPTLGAGVAVWAGAGIPEQRGLDRIDAPSATFLEVLPGVEVTASPHVVPFARLLASVPVGGTTLVQRDGGAGLVTPPVPTGDPGAGYTVQLGLQVRIGPLVQPSTDLRGR